MNTKRLSLFFPFLFVCLFLLLTSCQSTTSSIAELPEERGYVEIKKEYKNEDWTEVAKDVGEFRTRYPYSKYSAELELIQADSYFQSHDYLAAVVTYEDFIKRNPYDDNVQFASYRIAESYDRDASREIDRDQINSQKSVNKYNQFLEKFPDSKYANKAKERIGVLNRRLAEHDLFVATFYWHQHLYAAALMRYLHILENFKQFPDILSTARENGAVCYRKLADKLENDPKSEEFIFFKNETPKSLRAKGKLMAGTKNEKES